MSTFSIQAASSLRDVGNVRRIDRDFNTSLTRLVSGRRVNSAADDPTAAAHGAKFRAELLTIGKRVQGLNENLAAITVSADVADRGINIAHRILELGVRYRSGVLDNADREALNREYRDLLAELTRLGDATSYNGLSTNAGGSLPVGEPVTASSIITNGGFESPGTGLRGATTSLPGWTVSGNIDNVFHLAGKTAPEGDYLIDLTGGVPGRITQTVATEANARYELRFSHGGNNDWKFTSYTNDGPIKSIELYINGTLQGTYSIDTTNLNTQGEFGWTEVALEFTAASSSTTLSFKSLNTGVYGPVLDKVSLSRVGNNFAVDFPNLASLANSFSQDISDDTVAQAGSVISSLSGSAVKLYAAAQQIGRELSINLQRNETSRQTLSNFQDTDYAAETASLTRGSILKKASLTMLAISNEALRSVATIIPKFR